MEIHLLPTCILRGVWSGHIRNVLLAICGQNRRKLRWKWCTAVECVLLDMFFWLLEEWEVTMQYIRAGLQTCKYLIFVLQWSQELFNVSMESRQWRLIYFTIRISPPSFSWYLRKLDPQISKQDKGQLWRRPDMPRLVSCVVLGRTTGQLVWAQNRRPAAGLLHWVYSADTLRLVIVWGAVSCDTLRKEGEQPAFWGQLGRDDGHGVGFLREMQGAGWKARSLNTREYVCSQSGVEAGWAVGSVGWDWGEPQDLEVAGWPVCLCVSSYNYCLVFAFACLKEDDDLEDIDSLLEKIEDTNGLSQETQSGIIADSRPLLYIEHR